MLSSRGHKRYLLHCFLVRSQDSSIPASLAPTVDLGVQIHLDTVLDVTNLAAAEASVDDLGDLGANLIRVYPAAGPPPAEPGRLIEGRLTNMARRSTGACREAELWEKNFEDSGFHDYGEGGSLRGRWMCL